MGLDKISLKVRLAIFRSRKIIRQREIDTVGKAGVFLKSWNGFGPGAWEGSLEIDGGKAGGAAEWRRSKLGAERRVRLCQNLAVRPTILILVIHHC